MKFAGLLLALVALLAGCTSVDTRTDTTVDLSKFRHIYVESAANDSNQLDVLIAQELVRLGYDATSGVRTLRPDNAEAVVTYDGQWEWDFRTYLMNLNVSVRGAEKGQLLGSGRIFHPGVTKKSPAEMVHEVVAKLFPARK
ncbi:MAG: hypothetical protein HYV95_01790 [Opitutae bacterium]|nr:hypothetical protein [Opitutae bacterium]